MLFRLGILAIIASFLPWLAIALAPLVGLSLSGAAGLVGAALITAEILFWSGLALAGKDTWHAVRANGLRRAPRALARLLTRGHPRSAQA
jgi:hypothetical protein